MRPARILVVEDEKDLGNVIRTHLESEGHIVHQAFDGPSALALVERGEAPLGIVYETDARASKHVKVVGTFPPDSYPPIRYPFAIVAGRNTPAVRHFFQHLTSGPAAKVYERLGFQWRGPTG